MFAIDAQQHIHRPVGSDGLHARQPRQGGHQRVGAFAHGGHEGPGDCLAMANRGQARALHETRRARCIELDQLFDVGQQGLRCHQPAESPAGHLPGLAEGVRHHQPVVRVGHIEKRGRALTAIKDQPLIGFIRNHPDAQPPAVFDHHPLGIGRHHPAGRIAGRVDHQQAGVGRQCREQSIEVERPASGCRIDRQGNRLDAGPKHRGDRGQVGPQRHDGHHPVAGRQQGLRGQHEGGNA